MNESKYYMVRSVDLARALRWLTKENYMIFDDEKNPKFKIYSFQNSKKLRDALTDLNMLHRKYSE